MRALRFAYPDDSPRGKLLVLLARVTSADAQPAVMDLVVAVVDVATQRLESGPKDQVAPPLRAHADALTSDFVNCGHIDGSGNCAGWVDEEQ